MSGGRAALKLTVSAVSLLALLALPPVVRVFLSSPRVPSPFPPTGPPAKITAIMKQLDDEETILSRWLRHESIGAGARAGIVQSARSLATLCASSRDLEGPSQTTRRPLSEWAVLVDQQVATCDEMVSLAANESIGASRLRQAHALIVRRCVDCHNVFAPRPQGSP